MKFIIRLYFIIIKKIIPMKLLKSISVLTLLFCMALFTASCGGNTQSQEAESHEQSHSHDEDHSHDDGTHTHADGSTHADHDHEGESTAAAHGEGAAFTSAYVCPMHCEGSGSDTEGKCPTCGMSYVAQADHVKDGHKH